MNQEKTVLMTRGAVIAALYTALTLLLHPISYGPLQFRVAEALTLLPFFLPSSATPGLFLGCLFANLFGGGGIWDVVLGSTATLLAALWTARCKSRLTAAMPPVLLNAVLVGGMLWMLHFQGTTVPLWLPMVEVGLGQMGACVGLGLPLLRLLESRFPHWCERADWQDLPRLGLGRRS
ncbi:MAG: QueT transporter family protein [Clostridia bacterium]|nr:QueT transporter family protein [Clostridia bacterium]